MPPKWQLNKLKRLINPYPTRKQHSQNTSIPDNTALYARYKMRATKVQDTMRSVRAQPNR